jgi:hypothetical protein
MNSIHDKSFEKLLFTVNRYNNKLVYFTNDLNRLLIPLLLATSLGLFSYEYMKSAFFGMSIFCGFLSIVFIILHFCIDVGVGDIYEYPALSAFIASFHGEKQINIEDISNESEFWKKIIEDYTSSSKNVQEFTVELIVKQALLRLLYK